MKNNFQKVKDSFEKIPKYFVEQKVVFPIFSFDLTGEIDTASIIERAIPFKKENSLTSKPAIMLFGYQTDYIEKNAPNLFSDLEQVIETKAKLAFNQDYKVIESWFTFYQEGSEMKQHKHYYMDKQNFKVYPISAAYYPLCSNNSAPIVFENQSSNDVVIEVKQNTLLLFNSNLNHYVPKSIDNNLRLVYSCNLHVGE